MLHRPIVVWMCLSISILCMDFSMMVRYELSAQEPEAKGAQAPSSRFTSPLRRAVQRGLAEGGDIVKELRSLDDFTISVRRDAEAIVNALATLTPEQLVQRREENDNDSPLYALALWFERLDMENGLAYKIFQEKGIPQLIQAYDSVVTLSKSENEEDLVYILRILARYESQEGARRIIEAARRPLAPGSYWWYSIFSSLTKDHPHSDFVMRAIRAPLPDERIARQLLSSANQMMLAEELSEHPFDTPAGHKQLEIWLTQPSTDSSSNDYDDASPLIDATVALAFVKSEDRERLLRLAMQSPDKQIQLEAAWAAAKAEYKFGIDALVELCKELHYSATAKDYLEEIEKTDLIPVEALEPNFAAKAEFSQWLQHPNELAEVPDDLEIVDHRELPWPPSGEKKKFWLIRYLVKDKTGLEPDDVNIGLVGSMTWCFFAYDLNRRPIEDAYAIHAYFEMENNELIVESPEEEQLDVNRWLSQWKGEPLTDVEIVRVISANGELDLRNPVVALATAKLNDAKGWVVFDGPRTMWYPASDQPADEDGDYFDRAILMIHVGRQLLDLPLEVSDRQKYLANVVKPRTPEEIVTAFEKLLAELPTAKPERQQELLESYGMIAGHFDAYIDALVTLKSVDKEESLAKVYEQLLVIVDKLEGEAKLECSDAFSAIGSQFENYTNVLVKQNRQADVLALIKRFEPLWDYNYGYSQLGLAAHKAGDQELAEKLLTKLTEDEESAGYFFEDMLVLAEIWNSKGEAKRGQDIVVKSLKQLKVRIAEAREYLPSRASFTEDYKKTYVQFLKLYPDGEPRLKAEGLSPDLNPSKE